MLDPRPFRKFPFVGRTCFEGQNRGPNAPHTLAPFSLHPFGSIHANVAGKRIGRHGVVVTKAVMAKKRLRWCQAPFA
jgi:hypothetical protein